MKNKVLQVLKPKVSAFGFDKNEVMGIAADIANNLNLKEDATEDEVNEAIANAVDAVVPYLKYGQSQANRVINDFKAKQKKDEHEEGEGKKEGKEDKKDEKPDNSLKELTDALKSIQAKLDSLEAEKSTTQRRAKLEKLLDGSGAFGKSKLRDFSRMKFDKDDDFDTYYDEVKADLESFVQETANEGLGKTTPPQMPKAKKVSVMSDDELDEMAGNM